MLRMVAHPNGVRAQRVKLTGSALVTRRIVYFARECVSKREQDAPSLEQNRKFFPKAVTSSKEPSHCIWFCFVSCCSTPATTLQHPRAANSLVPNPSVSHLPVTNVTDL